VTESLPERLARLDREKAEADQRYNAALTALDRTVPATPGLPASPPAYDESRLPAINEAWNILPSGAPAADRSLKGRLRGFVWRLVGPPLEAQRHFNATLVDHLNRNVASHRDAQATAAALLDAARAHAESLRLLHAHLIQFLQTLTLYVDTKDRRVAGDLQVLNSSIDAITDDWLKRWTSELAPARRLQHGIAALEEMRTAASLAQQTALTVKREVERLTEAMAAAADASAQGAAGAAAMPPVDVNSFKYVGFEDAFRGSREAIRARLADYVARFEGASDVLDVGCGRGEFLDLLRERGIRARGLDVNHEMVEASRARGLDAVEADALAYLSSLPDASLGGLFSAQVIEHLPPDYLLGVLDAAAVKIRPGGLVILETINPACWAAFFESYIRDLTHVRPIHPQTLQFLLRASGFSPVDIEYRSPMDPATRLQPLPRPAGAVDPATEVLIETFNANVENLNARLFTFQDYAAIGRRPA
jgi:SAM-dependent methyltransferase